MTSYEIHVQGRLDPRWTAWFEGMTLTAGGDGTAVIRGRVPDQAALHGLLTRLRDLGLPLLSVTQADTMSAQVFFRTPRLVARAMRDSDVDAFVAYRADPDVARYQSWQDYTVEQGRALVAEMEGLRPGRPGEWYQLALEDADGELVGDLAARVDEDEPRLMEVGFTLAPAHQGQGYATEALRGLLGHAFETWSIHRVIAVTDALNAPAAALLARVGMRQEAHFRENVFFKGAWGSELVFAMLASEWAAGADRFRDAR